MKKPRIILLLIPLVAIILTPLGYAANLDREIMRSYADSDYATTAKLLEQKIEQLKKNTPGVKQVQFRNLRNFFLLAQIYASKLNEPEKALKIYQEVMQLKKSQKERNRMPLCELLFIADIYEGKKDFARAKKHYQRLLKELAPLQAKEHDSDLVVINEELMNLVKYQIDSINLRNQKDKKIELLLPKLKLSSCFLHVMAPYLTLAIAPTAEWDRSVAMKTDLSGYIEEGPTNLSSMFLGYSLILEASAGSVDESSEKALHAYLLKYPDGYFSLSLRYLFYKFYKESDQDTKSDQLLQEFENIARNRKMEIIVGPDARFSSPEKTWEMYKKALLRGDIDLAAECYVPGKRQIRETYRVFGKEKMKEIAEKMRPIEKIIANREGAKFRIRQDENGQEITYDIHFANINGEWKIVDF